MSTDINYELCLAHAEVQRAWDSSSPRAAQLVVRVATLLQAIGVANLRDDELAMALQMIGRFDPPNGVGSTYPRSLASFQRRAIVREWLADPTNALGDAKALLRGHEVNKGQENREANVPRENRAGSASIGALALQHAERMRVDQLFDLLAPLISEHSDRLPAIDLRSVARAVCFVLSVELPTTAKQQRQVVMDWVQAQRRRRAPPPAVEQRAASARGSSGAARGAAFSIAAADEGGPSGVPRPAERSLPARLAQRLSQPRARAAAGPRGGQAARAATAFVVESDGRISQLAPRAREREHGSDGGDGGSAREQQPSAYAGAALAAVGAGEAGGAAAAGTAGADTAGTEVVARASALPREASASIGAIEGDFLSALLVYPGVALAHVHWQSFGKLGSLNRAWRRWRGEEAVWQALCAALARDCRLYLPKLAAPPSAEAGALAAAEGGGGGGGRWARLWWEALYPARNAWRAAAEGGNGSSGVVDRFKIWVAVRLKPGAREDEGKVLLPLHQRLRLRAKGELLSAADAEVTVESLRGAGLLAEGTHLPAHVLSALAEARALDLCNAAARAAEQRERARALGYAAEADGADAEGEGQAEGAGQAPDGEAHAAAAAAPTAADGTSAGAGGTDGSSRAGAPAGAEDGAADEGSARARRGGGARVLLVQPSHVLMFYPGIGLRPFEFEKVYGAPQRAHADTQLRVYEGSARAAVAAALNGLNACVLFYGQTGSGKTHTAFGPPGVLAAGALDRAAEVVDERARTGRPFEVPEEWGVALRACAEVMAEVVTPSVAGVRTSVSAQYVQVYADRVFDLLAGRPVTLRAGSAPSAGEDGGGGGVQLVGADERPCASLCALLRLLALGEERKRYRATKMNERSSRAHTLLLLHVTRANEEAGALTRSHLHIVDLAGSEQLKLSGADGVSRQEAVAINYSLLCLGKVVSALLEERAHVPYRECALTLLLRASLGGSSRTTCIVTAPLCDAHAEQTFQSLKFGERCSLVTNTAALHVSSLSGALAAIDDALERCAASIASLEARGLGNSDGARKLRERSAELTQKRAGLSLSATESTSAA